MAFSIHLPYAATIVCRILHAALTFMENSGESKKRGEPHLPAPLPGAGALGRKVVGGNLGAGYAGMGGRKPPMGFGFERGAVSLAYTVIGRPTRREPASRQFNAARNLPSPNARQQGKGWGEEKEGRF